MIVINSIAKVSSATSVVQAAAAALNNALDDAGVDGAQLGAIISTSVGRDLNICEPAIAALIQQQAGIHLQFDPESDAAPPMTFDLIDGTSGFASAATVVEALDLAGDVEFAAIIVGDVHPSMNPFHKLAFGFRTDVYAVIVSTSGLGVASVGQVFAERLASPDRRGPEAFVDLVGVGAAGRSEITMRRPIFDADYAIAVAKYLTLVDSDTVVAPWPESFNEAFVAHTGMSPTIHNLYPRGRTHYTATPIAAIDALVNGLALPGDRFAVAPMPSENQVVLDVLVTA